MASGLAAGAQMKTPQFVDIIGGILAIGSLGVVSWAALNGSEQALGAMMAVVSASVGFFLRGKVEQSKP